MESEQATVNDGLSDALADEEVREKIREIGMKSG